MRIPKKRKRYCPYCNKHTDHKVENISSGHKRGAMTYGSLQRARLRGKARGSGNLGRYSKPAVAKFKRKTKSTKKTNLMYTCIVCGKSHYQKKGDRSGKIQMGDAGKSEKEKLAKW